VTATVRSAMRALDLIEFLSGQSKGTSLSQAAEQFSMPKSSTLMLLRTLVARGYVQRTDADRYVLTEEFRTGAFGWQGVPFANLAAMAQPQMQRLVNSLHESVTFGVMAAPGYARLLSKVVSDEEIRWDSALGVQIPLYCTANGRALLAPLSPAEREVHLAAAPMKQYTPHTVTDKARIASMLDEIAQQGYTIVMEEFALGGTGVAAPILNNKGRPVGALNVSCVTSRFHEKRAQVIAELLDAAANISRSLPQ
jgi:DNA-binding IclR family transcriptional regulator